jgi:ubiquitin-protein ligase
MIEVDSTKWAPTKKLVTVLDKIVSLLVAPSQENALNQNAAADFKNGQWEKKAKQMTQQYAQ